MSYFSGGHSLFHLLQIRFLHRQEIICNLWDWLVSGIRKYLTHKYQYREHKNWVSASLWPGTKKYNSKLGRWKHFQSTSFHLAQKWHQRSSCCELRVQTSASRCLHVVSEIYHWIHKEEISSHFIIICENHALKQDLCQSVWIHLTTTVVLKAPCNAV